MFAVLDAGIACDELVVPDISTRDTTDNKHQLFVADIGAEHPVVGSPCKQQAGHFFCVFGVVQQKSVNRRQQK